MSDFTTHTVTRVKCGKCTEPYSDDERGQLDFDTHEIAVSCVMGDGWKVDGDQARCPSCALVEECEQKGHVWDDWWPCRCGCAGAEARRIPEHTEPMECRSCARCANGEERVPVTEGGAS